MKRFFRNLKKNPGRRSGGGERSESPRSVHGRSIFDPVLVHVGDRISTHPKISPEGDAYPLTMGEEGPSPATGDDARFNHYLSMLSDEDPSRRWKGVEGLARLGDPRALGPLISALRDGDWRVRRKAAWALGVIGDPRAVMPLRRAMLNEMDSVKEMIEEAMQEIARKGMG
jgi:hypothetical protein